jgi:hypothetical protein
LAALERHVANLAAKVAHAVEVRASLDGVFDRAAAVALRRLGALAREVADDSAVVAPLGRDVGRAAPRWALAALGSDDSFLGGPCGQAALVLEMSDLSANVARLVAVRAVAYGVFDGSAAVALRGLGALSGDVADGAAVVAHARRGRQPRAPRALDRLVQGLVVEVEREFHGWVVQKAQNQTKSSEQNNPKMESLAD